LSSDALRASRWIRERYRGCGGLLFHGLWSRTARFYSRFPILLKNLSGLFDQVRTRDVKTTACVSTLCSIPQAHSANAASGTVCSRLRSSPRATASPCRRDCAVSRARSAFPAISVCPEELTEPPSPKSQPLGYFWVEYCKRRAAAYLPQIRSKLRDRVRH